MLIIRPKHEPSKGELKGKRIISIFLGDKGTQKGKGDTQNAITGTMPGIIWKVR